MKIKMGVEKTWDQTSSIQIKEEKGTTEDEMAGWHH